MEKTRIEYLGSSIQGGLGLLYIMGIKKDTGFVLRAFDFRETSKIVHVFTRNSGKIYGLLKGFRSGKKEFTSSLDIFSLNEFILYESRNELWLVSWADLIDDFRHLKESVEKNLIASYIVELVNRVTPLHFPSQKTFGLIQECLSYLEHNPQRKILYIFQIKILELSGFRPHLTACVKCLREIQKRVFFSVNLGGFLCSSCFGYDKLAKELPAELILSLKYIQNNDFKTSLRLSLTPGAEKQIFEILEEFLGYHLDARIKSLSSITVF